MEHSAFFYMDDKHRVKVGEPKYPVAAAERGKRVLVRLNESFEVGDHDFTKFSLIHSVTLSVCIPEDVTPSRHMTELCDMIQKKEQLSDKPMLFIYSDGGPDHRLTYLSAQLILISLFLKLDLDYLHAARTVPCHSWRNPAEDHVCYQLEFTMCRCHEEGSG